MTRLKHSGNQPAPLTDVSSAQLDSEQERLQAHSLSPLCCLTTAAHCMCYQCLSPPHFSFLQVKLKKGVMKYLKSNYWGLQRSAFLSLRISERKLVPVDLDVVQDKETEGEQMQEKLLRFRWRPLVQVI